VGFVVHARIVRRAAVKDERRDNGASYKLRSVHLRTGRAHKLARINQVFEEKGFSVELQRSAGFSGVPRHHRHVAENTHDYPACALGHRDMHGADDRTDLHDISPFSHCRLYGNRAGRCDDKKRCFAKTLQTHLIFSASDAAVVEFNVASSTTTPLYRMSMTHHKPSRAAVSKTRASTVRSDTSEARRTYAKRTQRTGQHERVCVSLAGLDGVLRAISVSFEFL
jgi:hypothetical protein